MFGQTISFVCMIYLAPRLPSNSLLWYGRTCDLCCNFGFSNLTIKLNLGFNSKYALLYFKFEYINSCLYYRFYSCNCIFFHNAMSCFADLSLPHFVLNKYINISAWFMFSKNFNIIINMNAFNVCWQFSYTYNFISHFWKEIS